MKGSFRHKRPQGEVDEANEYERFMKLIREDETANMEIELENAFQEGEISNQGMKGSSKSKGKGGQKVIKRPRTNEEDKEKRRTPFQVSTTSTTSKTRTTSSTPFDSSTLSFDDSLTAPALPTHIRRSKVNKTSNCNVIIKPLEQLSSAPPIPTTPPTPFVVDTFPSSKPRPPNPSLMKFPPPPPPPTSTSTFLSRPPSLFFPTSLFSTSEEDLSTDNELSSRSISPSPIFEPETEEIMFFRSPPSPTSSSSIIDTPEPEIRIKRHSDKIHSCPLCSKEEMNEETFVSHIDKKHSKEIGRRAVCPICASGPGGDPNYASRDLVGHVKLRHIAASTTQKLNLLGRIPKPFVPTETVARIPRGPFGLGLGRGLGLSFGGSSGVSEVFWDYFLSVDGTCAVDKTLPPCDKCLSHVKQSDTRSILACQHTFHSKCLPIEEPDPKCPLCEPPPKNKRKARKKRNS